MAHSRLQYPDEDEDQLFRHATFTHEDGLVSELDFKSYLDTLHGPMVEPLHDERFFEQAFIDHGVLAWPNGFDVCPDVLRFWCEQGRICSQEESDAHFIAFANA